ncbi:MAG: hypothetical protein ABI081_09285, partial [Burkholderiaceae bacterium]
TNADKRKAVNAMLADAEWSQWSDRKIAEQCGVSASFVGAMRKPEVAEKQNENRATSNKKKVEECSPTTPQKGNAATARAIDDTMPTSDELLIDMEETQAENAKLSETVEAMRSDDKAAEIAKLLTRVHGLEGRNSQLMAQLHSSEGREKAYAKTFHKLRKLLNAESHADILKAVEGFVAESV